MRQPRFTWASYHDPIERAELVEYLKQAPQLPFSSAPSRQNGGRVLTTIPVEIYDEIFAYYIEAEGSLTEAERAQAYSSLMLACRLFHTMFLPRRLHSINLSSSQNMKTVVNFAKRDYWPFDQYHTLVKHLVLSEWIPPRCYDSHDEEEMDEDDMSEKWMFLGVLCRIQTSFWRLVNVQSLTLDSVPIDSRFLKGVIIELVSLEVVKITRCCFEESDEELHVRDQPLTPWTEFHFSRNKNYSNWLASLASWSASIALTSFSTREWDVTRAVLSRPICFSALRDLSTPCQDSLFLRTFLQSTPSIVSLSVNPQPVPAPDFDGLDFAVVEEGFNLAADALPSLRSLRCPSVYLPGLISGRPVQHVDLPGFSYFEEGAAEDEETLEDMYRETVDTLDSLRRSKSPIHSLSIFIHTFQQVVGNTGWHGSASDENTQVLKDLEELTIYLNPRSYADNIVNIHNVLASSPRPVVPNVRTVHIRKAIPGVSFSPKVPIDLPREASYVFEYFAQSFPHATRISLSEHIEWQQSEEAGAIHWTPTVINRPSTRTYLLQIASSSVRTVYDWNGCLRGLFDEKELTRQARRMFMLEPFESPPSVYDFGLL